eukprot:10152030-Lingulodinium_polyedra.AAC.1
MQRREALTPDGLEGTARLPDQHLENLLCLVDCVIENLLQIAETAAERQDLPHSQLQRHPANADGQPRLLRIAGSTPHASS